MSSVNRPTGSGGGAPVSSLEELAHRLAPGLEIVSISQPEPTFRTYNVIGVTNGEDVARQAVISLESENEDDSSIGLVIMSVDPDADPVSERIDPEGVTGYVGSRSLVGGLIGALVGALLVGGLAAIIVGGAGAAIAGAVGGAMFGAPIGAIYVTFAGLGGSSAYRQTFVDPEIADVALVSMHTDDVEAARRAKERLSDHDHLEIVEIDGDGRELV